MVSLTADMVYEGARSSTGHLIPNLDASALLVRRATAYGVFAAIQGSGAVAGVTLAGMIYARSFPLLGATVAAIEAGALALYIAILRRSAN